MNEMEVIHQYIKLQVCLQMMMRSIIYLWINVSSVEDGIVDKNTFLMRLVVSLTI